MALKDLTRSAVDQALDEFDELGRDAFLGKYGFGKAKAYFVVRGDDLYDSKAIAGAAHGFVDPGWTALGPNDFVGGDATVAKVLSRLGFTVSSDTEKPDRNPPWSRDELILALDLYMTNPKSPPGKASKPVQELSDLLNKLAARTNATNGETFRNPAGVYMKTMNFRRFDPDVIASGKVGLSRGNKDEEVVWNLFAEHPERLKAVADAIRAQVLFGEEIISDPDEETYLVEAPEGRILTRVHRTRERDRKLVRDRKRKALNETGKLVCEVCDFDFAERYGVLGEGFIEVHHTKPVHTLPEGGKTKLEDLALVCSNCHRMIHSSKEWISIGELRSIVSRVD